MVSALDNPERRKFEQRVHSEREAERQRQQASLRRSTIAKETEPARRSFANVDSVLRQLTKSDARRKAARADLDAAIAAYSELAGHLVQERRVSDTRKALVELDDAVKATRAVLRSLPLTARTLFLRASREINTPLARTLPPILDGAVVAVRHACGAARGLPDKSPDHTVAILAYDVARIMKDGLRIKPTMTRDDVLATGARGGAAYARLLRAVLAQAGYPAEHVESLSAIMRKGIQLLRSPSLPRRNRSKSPAKSGQI
jgi:hypothetical protein